MTTAIDCNELARREGVSPRTARRWCEAAVANGQRLPGGERVERRGLRGYRIVVETAT